MTLAVHPADEEAYRSGGDISAPTRPMTTAERQRARQNAAFGAPDPHRALPASEEAEKGVLCSILLSPLEVMTLCQERGVKPDWFHIPALGTIYNVVVVMWLDSEPVDIVTLIQRLHDLGQLETCGGGAMVSDLFTYLPTPANVEYYLETLHEKKTLREVIRIANEAIKRAYDSPDDVASVVGSLQESATRLSLRGAQSEPTFHDILSTTADRWRERKEGKAQQICTRFERLDKASPLRRKHTLVISGRRKSGKSALAGSIVLRVAGDQRLPTLVFSLEMPSDEWVDRLLSDQGAISQKRIHSGDLEQKDWDRAAAAVEALRTAPVTIFDSIKMLDQIVAAMRRWKQQNPDGALCVIDYVQLVQVPHERGRNREQEVALVSKTLYNAGKELDLGVIELCQLNEYGDARESRAIEHDCTAMWQVLEDLDENGNCRKGREQARWVHVKFQRHGGRGDRIPFVFTGDLMRFVEEPGGPDEDAQQELLDVPAQSKRKGKRPGGAD